MSNDNEFKVNNLECKVKELKHKLREIELAKEIKMLEAELNLGAVDDKKNLIIGLFDWFSTNYPFSDQNDIQTVDIEKYLETIN